MHCKKTRILFRVLYPYKTSVFCLVLSPTNLFVTCFFPTKSLPKHLMNTKIHSVSLSLQKIHGYFRVCFPTSFLPTSSLGAQPPPFRYLLGLDTHRLPSGQELRSSYRRAAMESHPVPRPRCFCLGSYNATKKKWFC